MLTESSFRHLWLGAESHHPQYLINHQRMWYIKMKLVTFYYWNIKLKTTSKYIFYTWNFNACTFSFNLEWNCLSACRLDAFTSDINQMCSVCNVSTYTLRPSKYKSKCVLLRHSPVGLTCINHDPEYTKFHFGQPK
jgi:hypothetical protein